MHARVRRLARGTQVPWAVLGAGRVADLQLLDLLAQHLHDIGPDVEVGLVQRAQHERAEVGLAGALLVDVPDEADHRHVAREEHRLLGGAAGHGERSARDYSRTVRP